MRRLLILLTVSVLLTAGCGSDEDNGSDAATGSEGSEVFSGVTVDGDLGEEPSLSVSDPPFSIDETTTEVVEEGDAGEVQAGDLAELQYLGVNGRTGEVFDSSWSRGQSVTFPLEEGQLIQGFIDGLVGQTYGSRVVVAIPPADGFAGGNPQAGIEADDTLLFVVDLLEAAPKPLAMAEGERREPPADLPTLRTDGDGVPTGFEATPKTPKSVDELVAFPVIKGDGPQLEEGQTATVHYVGQIYPDGDVFDESWPRGQPAEFPLTQGGLIQGFLEGLIGQTVGSRVILAIPSELGYGPRGQPPDIGSNEDLIFVVDILAAS